MKLFTRLILVAVLLLLVLPMVVPGPDGNPIMSPNDWLDPGSWRLPEVDVPDIAMPTLNAPDSDPLLRAGEEESTDPEAGDLQYYRWQDEQGVWHFSDQPPADQELLPEDLPDIANRIETPAVVQGSGAEVPLDSNIGGLPSMPANVSREALEQQLEEAHRQRMGAEL